MLVPVPWQPGLLVHADLLVKLQQVRARMGRPPLLYGPLSGWRSFAEQEALWDAYRSGKGNPASNPTTGNRTHMRGVAGDLADYSPAMQRACVAVGLQRDPAEAWHWQLPNWRNYPIIAELPPEPEPEEEEEMPHNLVDASTRNDKGEAVNGTVCMTVWPSGVVQIYPRVIPTPAGETEFAVQMSRLFGAHRPVSHDVFESIRDAHLALRGGAADQKPVLAAVAAIPGKVVTGIADWFKRP